MCDGVSALILLVASCFIHGVTPPLLNMVTSRSSLRAVMLMMGGCAAPLVVVAGEGGGGGRRWILWISPGPSGTAQTGTGRLGWSGAGQGLTLHL
jgi:hypothetical protein